MLHAITDPQEIAQAQALLLHTLEEGLNKSKYMHSIGYQGGNISSDAVLMDDRIWFLASESNESSLPRYWNAFGLASNLKENGSNDITVEMNIALRDAPMRVGAVYARDTESGHTLLLHRGKIGGGRKGIGKESFLQWYHKDSVTLSRMGNEALSEQAFAIADLNSPEAVRRIGDFVVAVAEFKKYVEISSLSDDELLAKAHSSKRQPDVKYIETKVFLRDPNVAEIAKRRANGTCDLCNNEGPFIGRDDRPFLECHHVIRLADHGDDTPNNVVALCPNCHRKIHVLEDDEDIAILKERLNQIHSLESQRD